MSINKLKLLTHSYTNISDLSNEELITLIVEQLDIEIVPDAIQELYTRNKLQAINFANNILIHDLGDIYLQASIVPFLFSHDLNNFINYLNRSFYQINYYVFASILDCFSEEAYQHFGENLNIDILNKLKYQYCCYSQDEKQKIKENYNWFSISYSYKLEH